MKPGMVHICNPSTQEKQGGHSVENNLGHIVSKIKMANTQGRVCLTVPPSYYHNLAMKSRACSPGTQVWGYIPWYRGQPQPV